MNEARKGDQNEAPKWDRRKHSFWHEVRFRKKKKKTVRFVFKVFAKGIAVTEILTYKNRSEGNVQICYNRVA